ncbi:biotin transporter BioY [Xanthobacter autotrophicus]|uniref:biotin transporter BioY n=1 Tax=Xanthobacter autotrophicus TaxID=280 RepID=UPI0024A6D4C2|nr:biotin transporter BioY [Xanthobacter autotrophicus]MDI4655600.1 biotin transporter BioY [Xanthobacter autotrophicus]
MPSPALPFRPALARLADYSAAWAVAALVVGVALLSWSAQVSIPIQPVPITAQSYVLITLAALMGWQFGGLTVAIYLFAGLMGLPVFSGGRSGLGMLTGPSGGFIVGFLLTALLVGLLQETWARLKPLPLFGVLALGHLLLMVIGAGWLATKIGPTAALEKGFLPFLPGAVVKTVAALATVILVERLSGTERPR